MSDELDPIGETTALELLSGEHRAIKVVVNDVEHLIPIKQIKTGKIPKLLRACGTLIHTVTSGEKVDVNRMLLLHSDETLDMLSVLIERDRMFVDELEIHDSVRLVTECLEVNIDFFVQRVLPLLSNGALRLMAELNQKKEVLTRLAGLRQPSTSSAPATEKPTSGSTPTASSGAT